VVLDLFFGEAALFFGELFPEARVCSADMLHLQ
jgi:hypothetical protein